MKKVSLYIIISILLSCNSIDQQPREYSLNKYGQDFYEKVLKPNDQSLKQYFISLGVRLDAIHYKNQKLYATGSELNLSRTQRVVDDINESQSRVEIKSGPETIESLTEEDRKKFSEEFDFEWTEKKDN